MSTTDTLRAIEIGIEEMTNLIRHNLAAANIGNFHLELSIEGRTDGSGGVSIQFKLSEYGYGDTTKGRELDRVIAEFLHRHGFDEEQGRKLLSFSDPIEKNTNAQVAREIDDEISF